MSTFATLKTRIADEMHRGELTACATAVQNSILSSIDYWKLERFYFNHAVDITATASSSATRVPLSRFSSTILRLDHPVKCRVNNRDYPLSQRTSSFIADIDSGQWFGYPEMYAQEALQIRLYPPPNQDMVIKASGIVALPEVSIGASAGATNAWMTDAEAMIRQYAKADLYRNILHSPEQAEYFERESERAKKRLDRRTSHTDSARKVRPRLY